MTHSASTDPPVLPVIRQGLSLLSFLFQPGLLTYSASAAQDSFEEHHLELYHQWGNYHREETTGSSYRIKNNSLWHQRCFLQIFDDHTFINWKSTFDLSISMRKQQHLFYNNLQILFFTLITNELEIKIVSYNLEYPTWIISLDNTGWNEVWQKQLQQLQEIQVLLSQNLKNVLHQFFGQIWSGLAKCYRHLLQTHI